MHEEFAGMNMAEIMQDQMMSDNTSVIGGVKNKLGKGAKKMSSLEFHSWHGHKGYHPGCRVCELVARSLKRTYVDGTGLERRTLPRSRHWLLKYHATRDLLRWVRSRNVYRPRTGGIDAIEG